MNLADVKGVRFLNVCEDSGISVVELLFLHRGWMFQKREEKANAE